MVSIVEALAAPETVNTMPQPTLDAFVDHGHVGDMLREDAREADEVIAQVEALGIDVADLACDCIERARMPSSSRGVT